MYPECKRTQLQCEFEVNTERREGLGNTSAYRSQEDANDLISNLTDKTRMKSQRPQARVGVLLASPSHLCPHHQPQKRSSMEEAAEQGQAGVSLVQESPEPV